VSQASIANAAKNSGWPLAALSMLGVVSSMMLRIYLDQAHTESPVLDAFKSLLFWGDPGEPSVHAPPLINLSQRNILLAWAAFTGVVAVTCLVRATMTRVRDQQSQGRAIAVVISLLTLYTLWHIWPRLALLAQHA
jgi:hypothetical protein